MMFFKHYNQRPTGGSYDIVRILVETSPTLFLNLNLIPFMRNKHTTDRHKQVLRAFIWQLIMKAEFAY